MGLSVVWIAVGIAVWIAPGARRAGAGPCGTDRAIRIGTEKLMVKGSTVTFAQASGALLCSPSSPGCPASEWCAEVSLAACKDVCRLPYTRGFPMSTGAEIETALCILESALYVRIKP